MLANLIQNLKDTLQHAINLNPQQRALVIFDTQSKLSITLTEGYKEALQDMNQGADFINFSQTTPEAIFSAINALKPKDLVVLVQSSSFRLNEFRFRLELFNRELAVIEHPHLERMTDEEIPTYIDALAYDPDYYRVLGPKLKEKIDQAKQITLKGDGFELNYEGPFESTKLNIGDYREMKNTGGQFPIGEVFTEPVNLEGVNGTVKIFAFGDQTFHVIQPQEPQLLVIEKGVIVDAPNPTPEFTSVLEQIKMDEKLLVRELGLGMNRAFSRSRTVSDIGSYERMCGIHLSMGHKHTIYAKDGLPKRSSKYHVDVFADVKTVEIDGEVVFEGGAYCV